MSQNDRVILGFLTGAAIGGILALLYAPEKGEITRNRIADQAKAYGDDLNQRVTTTKEDLSANATRKKASIDEQIEETLDNANHRADEIITSLENKLAELRKKNQDLQKPKTGKKTTKA